MGLSDLSRTIRWIPKSARMPAAEDADEWGCVLVWDTLNGVKITGYRNKQELDRWPVTHWATPPKGPQKEGEKANGN